LYIKAIESFEKAMHYEPQNEYNMNTFGVACISYARLLLEESSRIANISKSFFTLVRKEDYKYKAKKVLIRSKALFSSMSEKNEMIKYYNLACLTAISGEHEECLSWLRKCKTHHHLVSDMLLTDKDFDYIRNELWFQEIVNELVQEESILPVKPTLPSGFTTE